MSFFFSLSRSSLCRHTLRVTPLSRATRFFFISFSLLDLPLSLSGPHSPGMSTTALGNLISGSQTSLAVIDPVDVDLIVHSIPQGTLQAGKSFSVACTLGVSASVREGQQCTLSLTVQRVQLSTAPTTSETAPPAVTATTPGATNACLASSGHGYGIPYATIIVDTPRWITDRIAAHNPACGT
jgi:hypothetical protein